MDYKELLNLCKKQPGWIGTHEQKNLEDNIKYAEWVIQQDEKSNSDVPMKQK